MGKTIKNGAYLKADGKTIVDAHGNVRTDCKVTTKGIELKTASKKNAKS